MILKYSTHSLSNIKSNLELDFMGFGFPNGLSDPHPTLIQYSMFDFLWFLADFNDMFYKKLPFEFIPS